MLIVNKLLPQGQGLAPVLLKRAAAVQLPWGLRQTQHFNAVDSQGRTLDVQLPETTVVRGGDVLVAQDGSMIRVEAALENVRVVTACGTHGSPLDLLRAAYHLGKRGVQLELQPDHLKIEPNPELADMLHALHLNVSESQLAFEPEGATPVSGAQNDGHAQGHAHAPDAAHASDHAHGQPHGEAGHVHGPGCGHDHGAPTPAPASRGKPLGIAIKSAPAPHVHGPGCGHDH